MLKNALFTVISLLVLASPQATLAAENQPTGASASQPAPVEMVPAQMVPAAKTPVEKSPVEMAPAEIVPFKAETAAPAKRPVHKTGQQQEHARDSQTDYRYCLDLKTDLEIAACRYRKK